MDEAIEIEHKLLDWINAQPNSTEIKQWMLSEHQRRIEWQEEVGITNPRALAIDDDVMDALFYMARLTTLPARRSVIYGNAYFSLIVGLKRVGIDA
jgi:hypothetical protein